MESFAHFSDTSRNPESGYEFCCAAIAVLCFLITPLTVFLGITAIVIFSIYGVIRWAHAHIFHKVLKRIKPAFTNRNAATAVIRIGLVIGIGAACFHVLPTAVGESINRSMYGGSLPHIVSPVASTGFCAGVNQCGLLSLNNVSAIALAPPIPNRTHPLSMFESSGFGLANDGKSGSFNPSSEHYLSNWLSGGYYFLRHNDYSVVFSNGCSASTGTRYAYYDHSQNFINQI